MKNSISLDERLSILKNCILRHQNEINKNMVEFYERKFKFIIFISVSDGESRAYVCRGIGNSIDTSWKNATDQVVKLIKQQNLSPKWIKADIVNHIRKYSYESFLQNVISTKNNYFREGISFDSMFNLAFLEQEVNANVFFRGLKEDKCQLDFKNINFYSKKYRGLNDLVEENIKDVYTFKTKSYFHDGLNHYELLNEWLNNGRRELDKVDKELVYSIIDKSSQFLADQVEREGKFVYGYFPCFDKKIDNYNILRHASTTYSMIEAWEVTGNNCLKEAIDRAINYLLNDSIQYNIDSKGIKRAFVVEKVNGNEIKLGANAHAILALTKYICVFKDRRFLPVVRQLAEGISYFQNKNDGYFVHVLNSEGLSIKEKFRTIYYDGEAAFALMRLYEIDRDDKWLKIVEKAFDFFIKAKHWKYGDHWLSYCSNELIKHRPEKKYIEFNLRNVEGKLDFCLSRETAYPTLLELLMASYCMLTKIKSNNLYLELLDNFDEDKLMRAISHRSQHQLNSWFLPEFAMYYKAPHKILWSFYIRHHSFRVRIDDIEHNISGYCNYYYNIAQNQEIVRSQIV